MGDWKAELLLTWYEAVITLGLEEVLSIRPYQVMSLLLCLNPEDVYGTWKSIWKKKQEIKVHIEIVKLIWNAYRLSVIAMVQSD